MKQKEILPRPIVYGRMVLLLMIVFTFLNIILYYMNSKISFPYSAFTPYFAVIFGDYLSATTGSLIFIIVFYIVALLFFAIYIFGWFASRKKFGWFIVVSIIYTLDTAFMTYALIGTSGMELFINLALHAFIIYAFVNAALYPIREKNRLKSSGKTADVIVESNEVKKEAKETEV
jgi:hypothetical protein